MVVSCCFSTHKLCMYAGIAIPLEIERGAKKTVVNNPRFSQCVGLNQTGETPH